MEDRKEALGYFWTDNMGIKPFYSERVITRGKKKGQIEIEYLAVRDTGPYFRKAIIEENQIRGRVEAC
jgi:hypothetical protein